MNSGLDGQQGGIRVAGGAIWGDIRSHGVDQEMNAAMIASYAETSAARELIFDEAHIRKQGDVITGDLVVVWARLREHAARFSVPFIEGDLERTNRVPEWDHLVIDDAGAWRAWDREYPRALVRMCSLDPDDDAGRRALARLDESSILWNALVPLALRKPGLTDEIRAKPMNVTRALSSTVPDGAVVATSRMVNLSDYARVQYAVQSGDFAGALYREGLDPMTYARLSESWAERLARDPELRGEYDRLLECLHELALTTQTRRLPILDAVVFPGEKLGQVSDFARISRAARQGRFKEALERAGVDQLTFANLCARFNERMAEDEAIAAQFHRLLSDARLDLPAA